jgi:hypothetical protein
MPGATIMVDRREGEEEVFITVIAGPTPEEELEKVTVPPGPEASDEDGDSGPE